MTLNQIIFEHIDDNYAYGKYGEFKVITMTKNRYINATKLCKEYDKNFYHWKENKSNINLINSVEKFSALGNPGAENKSFIIINGGKNQIIKGTYVHELLIPHIASWISSDFAIKVSEIITNYIANEYINEIKMKNNEIKDKNNKIDSLEEKLNTIIKNNEELLKANEKTNKINEKILKNNEDLLKFNKSMEKSLTNANYKLDETLEKLDEVHEELENTNEELEDTNEKLDITDKTLKIVAKKLDIAVEDRVVKTKSKLKNESFYKKNIYIFFIK